MGTGRGSVSWKGGHGVGCLSHKPADSDAGPRERHLLVGFSREAPAALLSQACELASGQSHRGGKVRAQCLSQPSTTLWPFLHGQSPDQCQVLTLIHTRGVNWTLGDFVLGGGGVVLFWDNPALGRGLSQTLIGHLLGPSLSHPAHTHCLTNPHHM